jgi:hypothetical protein
MAQAEAVRYVGAGYVVCVDANSPGGSNVKRALCGFLASLMLFFSGSGLAQGFSYSDGSANTYKIAPGKLEYIPLRKENSSSGAYSGGTAKTVKLSDADYQALISLFEQAMAQKTSHGDRRVMMSGVITKNIENDRASVILKPGAGIKDQIEARLLEILKRGK